MKLPLALLVAAALAPLPAAAQPSTPATPPPTMTVTGTGTVTRSPDQVTIPFSIVTSDDAATRATSANNAIVRQLGSRLGALGLPASALRTSAYGISYIPRPPRPNPESTQRYGYIVSRTISVTTGRTDAVGAILDAAVGAGATGVLGVTFGLRDPAPAYHAALAAAVADAQAQARALAAAAHVRLGALRSIEPSSTSASPIRPLALALPPPPQPGIPTEVEPSDLTVRATVVLTYAFGP